jgi:branched-chain amino acid transport system substrate-binding protein
MKSWVCKGVAKDGQPHSNQNPPGPHEEFENFGPDCVICGLTQEQVEGGGRGGGVGLPVAKIAAAAAVVLVVGGMGVGIQKLFSNGTGPEPTPTPTITSTPTNGSRSYTWEPTRFSWGQQTLFSGTDNPLRNDGIEAFNQGDYAAAIDRFQRAVSGNRNDPEVLIFLNNARARQKGNPVTLAVVVPVDNAGNSAQEMLRGVAQAQDAFNLSRGDGEPLLEIVIANDGNKPESSQKVAEELAKDPSILGVIGHNDSDASKAALNTYQAAGLAVISPTSTSMELDSEVFFRTVPSDAIAAERLARYARDDMGVAKATIFYNPNSSYSRSLQAAFEQEFKQLGGNASSQDMTDSEFDAGIAVSTAASEDGADVLVLFPDTSYRTVAVEIAKANAKLQSRKMDILGGDSLYLIDILTAGGASMEGLTLAVPWFSGSGQFEAFSRKSEQQWGGRVSWRTATSFDATQALIQSLSDGANRAKVLQNLKQVSLDATETSGQALAFTDEGERQSDPLLVRVSRGPGATAGLEFGFELLPD